MTHSETAVVLAGAASLGIVMGWVTARVVARTEKVGPKDIGVILASAGGSALAALYKGQAAAFGTYCIGLLVGFTFYNLLDEEPERTSRKRNVTPPSSSDAGSGGDAT